MAKRHGGSRRHLRNRVACRHLLRELHGRDAGRPQGHRAALPVGHRIRVLRSERAHQLAGRGSGRDGAARLQPRNRGPGAPGRAAERVRVLLHPELPLRYRDRELRPFGHYRHRQVPAEPQLYAAGPYERHRLDYRRNAARENFLLEAFHALAATVIVCITTFIHLGDKFLPPSDMLCKNNSIHSK